MTMMLAQTRLVVVPVALLMLLSATAIEAFAFTALTTDARRYCREGPMSSPPGAKSGRKAWARTAKPDSKDSGNDNKLDVLTGSGLRGMDTSKLKGNERRDAEWFQRTADREGRGQLAFFEDPAFYIAVSVLAPLVILTWGVLNCYIPGFCPVTL